MRIQHYLSCVCLLLIGVVHMQAQTQYVGPDNGDWFTAANWNNGLPAAGNDALVGGGVTVVVGSSLTVNFGITAFGNITATAPVTVAAGGSIANSGTFAFNAGSSLTNNATVQNFGTMTLVAGANFTNETGANFTNSGPLTVSSTLTNRGGFVNNGTIDALNGTVQTQGSFNNNQVLNTKTLTVSTGSTFTNDFGSVLSITGASASLQVDGSFTNNGTVNASGLMTVNGNFTNNVTLNVASGTVLTVNASAQLNNGGTLDNSGFLQNYGTFTNGNTLINKGEANNFGTFNNNNLIDNRIAGTFFNRAGGTLGMGFGSRIANAGSFTNLAAINSFGTIENNGIYANSGTILSFGGSLLDNNSTFTNSGTISTNDVATNDGTFTNSGTLNVNGGSVWSNFANFNNAVGGTINVVQDFNNKTTGVLVNNGKFVNTVRTSNEGSFTNNAFLSNPGDITNAAGATLTNNEFFYLQAGNLLNAGTLVNTDKTLVDECSSVKNTGSINNTGGNVELHGLLFQKGTTSGNALNTQGGYVHTNTTSNAPAVCQSGSFGANIDGDIKVYANSIVALEASDSCANIVYLANGLARPVFHCTDIGTIQNVNLLIRTRLGDSLTCVAQVTPVDLLEPQISNCPKDQIIFTPNNTATATWTAPTATDNCSSTVNVTSTHTPGSSFPVGITGVTYTFTDAAGNPNQCQFRIDLRKTPAGSNCTGDTAGPTFTGCPSNISAPKLGNLTPVSWNVPTPSDNCKPITMTSTHIPGTAFAVGTTTVTYTAKDGSNNSSTCSFTVTITSQDPCVSDTQKPTFSGCPSNLLLPTNATINGAVAYWNAPGAGDNCGVTTLNASHVPGSVFPVGTTTVTYTATDAASNSATCSFSITVGSDPCPGDTAGPSISGCPANISLLTSGTSATATWTAPTATDACTPVTLNNNYAPGNTFPLGVTQVTYQFSDKKGNTSTCNFTVTVQNACAVDNVAPVITGCPANITVAAGTGGTATATWTAPTATDNCGMSSFVSAYQPGATFPTGTTTVVYTAIDLKGNGANCSFNVNVVTAPGCTSNAAPINNTTGVNPASVTLSWISAANASSYDVYLGTVNPPTATVATNVAGTTTTVTNLNSGATYFWYVVPKNTAGSATGCASGVTNFVTTAPVVAYCKGTAGAGLAVSTWTGITGTSITDLTNNVNYPNNPSNNTINAGAVSTWNLVDNYGVRVTGVITPNQTGNYTFYVTGDDQTQLFLSNNASVTGKTMIAQVPGWTNITEFTKYTNQKSATIALTAGQDYYVELLMKEGGGGDGWGIYWVAPGTTTIVAVPVARLSPAVTIPDPTITLTQATCAAPTGSVNITNLPAGFSSRLDNGAWTVNKTSYTGIAGGNHTVSISLDGCSKSTAFTVSTFVQTPTANCKNITRQQTAAGQSVQIAGTDVNNGSTAGCGATITSYNVSPTSFSAPGTYTVTLTVTNSLGLSATCTSTVTILAATPCIDVVCEANVNDGPWLTLTNCTLDVCAGSRVFLSAAPQNMASYQWTGPNGFSGAGYPGYGDIHISESISSANAGNYTVVVTNSSGCTASKVITVNVTTCTGCDNVTGGGTIGKACSNGQVSLNSVYLPSGGSGGIEYVWMKGTTSCDVNTMTAVPSSNTASLTIASPSVTTYFVRCSRRVGCTSWDGESNCVTVNANECAPATTCAGNLLVNSGFENGGTSGWTWMQNAGTTTSSPYAGTRSLQICTGTGGISQYLPALPGLGYTLKVNAKISGTTGSVGLRFYDKNWVELSVPSVAVTATSYTNYTVTATAPYATAYVEAWAWKNINGCLNADEFCLTSAAGFPACSNNLLGALNPGFESSFTSWDWVDNATITTTEFYSGTKAAQVCTSLIGGGAGNQITAIPGATYSLQVRAKISGSPNWAGIGINFYDANWNPIGHDVSRGVTSTTWGLYLVQGVAPINAKYVDFWFWKDAGGCMYVDDFCASATGGGSTVCDPDVLFVVGNTVLNSGDTWVKNRLQSLGLNVTVKSATAATATDATGKGLVVISTTINSADVTSKFTNVTVPIVTWESYILDDLKMTGSVAQSDYGENNTYSSLVINNPSHPLSAGLSGTVQVFTSGVWIRWGATANAAAIKAASVAGQSSWWGVLGYDKNAAMQGGFIAPARRVSLFLNDDTPGLLTANGMKLFDAAIEWAIGCNLNNVDGNTQQVAVRNGEDLESIETAVKSVSDVQVFPNPAYDKLYLEFNAGGNDATTIRLFDINGRAVQEWEIDASGDPIELQLE
ncbi:MAG: HYR domain-containing protein, partial [Saprospiraceae bacterium]|nr:HYR domain-containing protein [Saprospiraceae bacterium]